MVGLSESGTLLTLDFRSSTFVVQLHPSRPLTVHITNTTSHIDKRS